jgi:hypothetical protein
MNTAFRLLASVLLLGCNASGSDADYEITMLDARRYAEEYCRASSSCCEDASPNCVEETSMALLSWKAKAGGTLVYSESCVEEALAWIATLGCEPEQKLLSPPECLAAHGTGTHGDACSALGVLGLMSSTCREGLDCVSDRCVDPSFNPGPGARAGENCDPFTWCDSALFCSDAGVCEARHSVGEPCSEHSNCAPSSDAFCDLAQAGGTGMCASKVQMGEACNIDAACPFLCDDTGYCQSLSCTGGICSPRGPAVCEREEAM